MNPSASPTHSDFDDRECFALLVSVRRGTTMPTPAEVSYLLATIGGGLLAGHDDDVSGDLRVELIPESTETGNVAPWRMEQWLEDLDEDDRELALKLLRQHKAQQ